MALESEIKFALEPAAARKLLKLKALKSAATGKAVRRQLVSTYFDTRHHRLRKAGLALRVRQSGDTCEQTIKVPASGPPGMQNFEEYNVELSGPEPDLGRFDKPVLHHLPGRGKNLKLLPVFTTHIQRTTLDLSRGKTRFELALDVGQLRGYTSQRRQQPVCEVEFELIAGSALKMLDFIIGVSEQVELRPLYMTKAQRGYTLARPELALKRAKARPVHLDVRSTVGDAFLQIVGEALRHLQSNHYPTREGRPGGIHQTRVAIRRIRAALRAFKRVLPYDKRKAFNGEFRWFQSRLAPARDWHVFLSETLPRIAGDQAGSEAVLAQLRELALKERRRATIEAREVIDSQRYMRLLLQFQRWLLALGKDNTAMFEMPLKDFAGDVLDKTRRDFLLDRRPLSRMSEEDRHSLRKRGKKARYATEFFACLWEGPAVASYLGLMEAVQDQLGEANDAVVARLLMASLPPRALAPPSLLLVQEWSQNRELQCNRAGQPIWRRIQQAVPFWSAQT